MKVLIAMDSFKGSLSASEACDAVEAGIKEINKEIECIKRPVADGGEGTVNTLVDTLNGRRVFLTVKDPLMRDIEVYYGIINTNTAIVEMAISSGLTLIEKSERNPLFTSTYGVGEIINDALNKGLKKFIIGIGGSATNDAGIGMLNALGARFYDDNNNLLKPIGESLKLINHIDLDGFDKRIQTAKFLIACDVNNPLFGKNGAAYIFAPQKGANQIEVKQLDQGLKKFHKLVNKTLNIDFHSLKGAGAAGGLGYAFSCFFSADLKPGIEIIFELLKIKEELKDVDMVITGEGKIDSQTKMGKVLSGIGLLAKKYHLPVIAIGGIVEQNLNLEDIGINSLYSIITHDANLEEAMQKANAYQLLKTETKAIFKDIRQKKGTI